MDAIHHAMAIDPAEIDVPIMWYSEANVFGFRVNKFKELIEHNILCVLFIAFVESFFITRTDVNFN